MRFNYKLSRSARRMAEAGKGVALRIATDILETIITLSSQPRADGPAEQFGEGVQRFAAGKYINGKRGWAKPSSDRLKPVPPAARNFRPSPPV